MSAAIADDNTQDTGPVDGQSGLSDLNDRADIGHMARRLGDMALLVSAGVPPNDAALRVRVRDVLVPEPPAVSLGDPDALARVAIGFDVDGLNGVLDEGFALGGFDEVVDGWLLPALHQLGEWWREGLLGVAEEHFASASVHRRLAQAYDDSPVATDAPTVLVGLAPGARHELGVLAFATALRRRAVGTVYLGGDVPVGAWVAAVRQRRPDGVVIAVPSIEDVGPSRELVAALHRAVPGLTVLVGGCHQGLVGGDVTPLGHRIVPAADRLAGALRAKV